MSTQLAIASFEKEEEGHKPKTLCVLLKLERASLVAQTVKNMPAVWETQVQSLGWKDPLEKEMITHSSILA